MPLNIMALSHLKMLLVKTTSSSKLMTNGMKGMVPELKRLLKIKIKPSLLG
jgi:hypothetical protein